MKKILLGLGSIALALAIFAGGVYANEQGWLSFTGDDEIGQSQTNVDEIMKILRNVNDGKITAEQGVAQLTSEVDSLEGQVEQLENLLDGVTGENPGQKIQFLKGEVERLFNDNEELKKENAVLTTDLAAANKTIETQEGTITTHLETIEENKNEYASLKQLQADTKEKLDNAISERDTLQADYNSLNDSYTSVQGELEQENEYVTHLESELTTANNLVKEHADYTEKALEEARGYGGDNSEQ